MSHSFKIFIFLWVHLSLPFPLSKQLAIKDLVDYSLGRITARPDISCHITRGITSIFICDSSTLYILSEYFLSALSDYALRCSILKFTSSKLTLMSFPPNMFLLFILYLRMASSSEPSDNPSQNHA